MDLLPIRRAGMKKVKAVLVWIGVVILQIAASQVATLILSFILPMDTPGRLGQAGFALALILTFTAGIFLVGWLALSLHWLSSPMKLALRLAGTLICCALPLTFYPLLIQPLQPGSPAYALAILLGILGFHLPGWLLKK
jgi:hypothetical protein